MVTMDIMQGMDLTITHSGNRYIGKVDSRHTWVQFSCVVLLCSWIQNDFFVLFLSTAHLYRHYHASDTFTETCYVLACAQET